MEVARSGPFLTPQRHAVSPHGMVATAHFAATEAAVSILEEGGNAVDAAVAAAFALGVCEPAASGLGGQTMMLIHLAEKGKTFALDGSSRAPHRAVPGSVARDERLTGHRATTVPSTPAVLEYARTEYGSLPLPVLLRPAVSLAEEGYPVTRLQRNLMRRERKRLMSGTAAEFFLRDGRHSYLVGQTLRQPVLAETLKQLARKGVEDFYTGTIARAIHADMVKHGGLIRRDDLAQIPWPIERRPLSGHFESLRVLTFPPPGAGRTLMEMLNILQQFPPSLWSSDTPKGAILLAEVIQRAFLDRSDRPFDPNFYPQVRGRRMMSVDYAREAAQQIAERLGGGGETTHLSVMDRFGNVVALTQSIERVFGAAAAAPDLGFLYNNYLLAFEHEDVSHPYYLRPNAVPWASVAPTIVFRGRVPWLALGSPGSDRITSSILQVLIQLGSRPPYQAVEAPRLHCSLRGRVSLEAGRMRNDIPRALEQRGFRVERFEDFSFYLGCVQLAMRETECFTGVADPRRDGSAGGPSS